MPYCSACGAQLSEEPNESVWKPNEDEPNNKEEAVQAGYHMQLIESEKGTRFQCLKKGTFAKPVNSPPSDDEGEEESGGDSPSGGGGQGPAPNKAAPQQGPSQQSPQQPRGDGQVFDLPEDKNALDILEDVAANPAYELSESQVNEVMDWGEIYDGQMPADVLEQLLGNMSGVSKQQASLMRQKYEIKLNKWVREKTKDQGGPPIGGARPMPGQQGPAAPDMRPNQGGGGQQQGQRPQPEPSREHPEPEDESNPVEERVEDMGEMRDERRKRRFKRRQDMIDAAAEEMAVNMASDAGKMYSDMRDIITTVLKRKAERDPDWFLEKADQFGMDIIDDLAEPSDAMKEEEEMERSAPQPDAEIEELINDMDGEKPAPEQDKQPQPDRRVQEDTPPDEHVPEPTAEDTEESDDEFDELMGDISS